MVLKILALIIDETKPSSYHKPIVLPLKVFTHRRYIAYPANNIMITNKYLPHLKLPQDIFLKLFLILEINKPINNILGAN